MNISKLSEKDITYLESVVKPGLSTLSKSIETSDDIVEKAFFQKQYDVSLQAYANYFGIDSDELTELIKNYDNEERTLIKNIWDVRKFQVEADRINPETIVVSLGFFIEAKKDLDVKTLISKHSCKASGLGCSMVIPVSALENIKTITVETTNKLKENETKIEQRTLVYDTIAKRTERQSRLISLYAREGRESSDMRVKEDRKGKITLLGAYIKRYANLMLLSGQSESIEIGELALSVAEVLRYLNYYGIPAEVFSDAAGKVRAQAALSVFEAFETLLETNLSTLRGVFVNLSAEEQPLFKITLENMQTALPQALTQTLRAAGVDSEISREDDVTYIRFTLPKGGGA